MRITRIFSLLVVAGAIVLTATPACAQQSNDGGVGFGLEAGITRASLDADGASDFFKTRSGYLLGIWLGGNRDGLLGFMGEISYQERKNETLAGDFDAKYLEIPALVRINLGTRNKNGLLIYPMVGPVIDIQLKSKLSDFDVKDNFNGFDFGIIGGVGVEVARIGIEGRMNWGLKTLKKTGVGTFGNLKDTKSKTVQFLVKIRLN